MKIEPIGVIDGCYPEKFGIPRQARIVNSAEAEIQFLAPYRSKDFLDGLENYTHIWLIFGFHQNEWTGDAKVRPQRLGGNQKMGVLATRSPYRPNGLGLSAVKIISIDVENVTIKVAGHDLVNGTPIYDIKPYVPFTDSIEEASSSFANIPPDCYEVEIMESAQMAFNLLDEKTKDLIRSVIAQNPLPPFHQDMNRIYGVSILDLNIKFRRNESGFQILGIHRNF